MNIGDRKGIEEWGGAGDPGNPEDGGSREEGGVTGDPEHQDQVNPETEETMETLGSKEDEEAPEVQSFRGAIFAEVGWYEISIQIYWIGYHVLWSSQSNAWLSSQSHA